MAGLTVAGTDFELTAFEELEPRTKGQLVPTFDNTLRSGIHSEKRRFRATTSPVSKTKYEAMQTAFANGASMTVTGDVLLGDSLTMRGRLTYSLAGVHTADAGYNHVYSLTFSLEEV